MTKAGGNANDTEEPIVTSTTTLTDEELLKQASELYKDDQLLAAARILEKVEDKSTLTDEHLTILDKAKVGKNLVKNLKSEINDDDSADEGSKWIKQGLTKGKNPTLICYKLEKKDASSSVQITVRVETPVHKSMLVPILSVLNETELYQSWLPNWSTPKFRIRKVEKLAQAGRASQIIIVTNDLPWPIAAREIVLDAMAFDDIEESGDIGIHMGSIDEDYKGVVVVPPPEDKKIVRVDLEGGFLFRSCPEDHPTLKTYRKLEAERLEKESLDNANNDEEKKDRDDEDDEIILVTFCACVDPKLGFIPQSFLNFMMRTVMGTAWKMLLKVAEDVRDGKREEHASAIEKKRTSLYDWVEARVKRMFLLVRSGFNLIDTDTTQQLAV